MDTLGAGDVGMWTGCGIDGWCTCGRLVALDLGLGIQLSLQQTLDALQQTFLNTTYRHTEATGFHYLPMQSAFDMSEGSCAAF